MTLKFIVANLRLGQGVFDQKWGRLNWLRRMEKNLTMKVGGNTLENLIEVKYGDSVNHNSTIPCWSVWLISVMAKTVDFYIHGSSHFSKWDIAREWIVCIFTFFYFKRILTWILLKCRKDTRNQTARFLEFFPEISSLS